MSEKSPAARILKVLYTIEDAMVVTVLLTMIVIAFLQIALRNLATSGISWGDPFLRYLVLWVGLLGAMVATREDNHIRIDILPNFIKSEKIKIIARIINDIFAATVCFFLTYASIEFLKLEAEGNLFAFGTVPAWVGELILPFGFSIIGLRFAVFAVLRIISVAKGEPMPDFSPPDNGVTGAEQ
jgi:TRAP-type C4-dicarboxylate transport system permease small subunit